MRVNSAYEGVLKNRVTLTSGITIAMLAIFLITSSFTKERDRDLRAKQVNLTIRQIGHRLLLQSGDSTSRVLPVTEIQEGTFQLRFENLLFFNNDSLVLLSQSLLPKTQFPSGYTVTVHDCLKSEIVYGFQVNNFSRDIIPCLGRSQAQGCYRIEIAFPDLYDDVEPGKNIKHKKANIAKATKEQNPVKPYFQEANSKPKEFKATTFQSESLITRRQSQSDSLINLVFGTMLVLLLSVTLLIGRRGKNVKPMPVNNKDHSQLSELREPVKEYAPEFAALGKFLFDVKDQRLLMGDEVISLTDKEYRILELLHKSFGELIPRETLMQKVWINEGVITGRSLDMFVSKLRKKLSSDPELRITNVHGKGYKLEMQS